MALGGAPAVWISSCTLLLLRDRRRRSTWSTAGEAAYEHGLSLLVRSSVGVHPDRPREYQVGLSQGGIPFATREMLVGPHNVTDSYTNFVRKMLSLAGFQSDAAARMAKDVVDLQTNIANISWSVEQMREPEKLNNPVRLRKDSCDVLLLLRVMLSFAAEKFSSTE
jgi:predicted metalloendopeptidase